MFVYYFFILLVAIIFFYLLRLKSTLFFGSKLLIFFLVLWAFIVCCLFPGIASFISPLLALLATVFFAVSGGYVIYSITAYRSMRSAQNTVPLLLLPPGKSEEQLLLPTATGENEQREEFLLPAGKDLETLINSGFKAKEEKNYATAVGLFHRALDFAESGSLKAMIHTELVFLYKEMGQYIKGAKILEDFISNNASFLTPSLHSQFKRLVNYLHELNELLIKAGHPNLPFSKVPQLIKIKAEQALKE